MTRKSRLIIAEQSAIGIGGHYFAYTSCVAQAAERAGLDVTILYNHALKTSWNVENIRTGPAFHLSWSEAERQGIREWRQGNIAHDFALAIAGDKLAELDHILFPTLGRVDLENVLRYLLALSPAEVRANYHIILRYDVSEIAPLMNVFGPIFKTIARSSISKNIHFHTDTDLLSEDYTKLMGVNFSTLPIPFNQAALLNTVSKSKTSDRKRIIYLGDARLEKNFHAIPDAATTLWESGFSRTVDFCLQCNFNCEGGEPGQMTAVQKLGQFPGSFVHLMPDPLSDSDYYRVLAEADIVLIPYDADRYRSRSSGVLVEAMAAGKPVVTTRGSWMETFVPADQAVIVDKPEALGAALVTLLSRYEDYRTAAEARAPAMLDWSSGANFIRHLLSFQIGAASANATDRPSALVVMNANAAVLRNGASRIAQAQLDYLSRRGYAVTGLFLGRPDHSGLAFSHDLLDAIHDLPLDRAFLCCPPVGSLNIARLEATLDRRTQAINHDLEVSRSYQFDSEFLNGLQANRPDVVLLNYITNYGVVESLDLADVPVVCEMHDVQSFQKAIYGNRPVSKDDLDCEFFYLAKCHALISLNPVETQYVQERLPDTPCVTTGVQLPVIDINFGTIAGCQTTADIIRLAAPSKFGHVSYANHEGGILGDVLRQIAEYPTIDLLFVSSNHKANAVGLREFLETVYIPRLAPLGITFVIAGSIDTMGPWPEHPLLAFVGRVENLDILYAAAQVVVLPISEGAGSPVKTYEALSYRRPIVASSLALRGFAAGAIQIAATPIAEFGNEIMRLISHPDERAAARGVMHDYLVEARSRMDFDRAMDQILATIAAPVPTNGADLTFTPPLPPLSRVEWTTTTACVSRIIRGLILDGSVAANLLVPLLGLNRNEALQIVREMLDALVIRQDAPLLAIESDLAWALRSLGSDREACAQTLSRYIELLLTDSDEHAPDAPRPVLLRRRNATPVRIGAIALRPGASPRLRLANEDLPETRRTHDRTDWIVADDKRDKGSWPFVELALEDDWQSHSWIVSQTLSDMELGADGTFCLPDLGATRGDLLMIEFELWKPLKDGEGLGCRIDRDWADLTIDMRDQRTVYRVNLLPAKLQTIGNIRLLLETVDARGHILRIIPRVLTVHRVLGGRGCAMLRYLGAPDTTQLDRKRPDDFAVRAEVIARALEFGLAMDRSDLALVRDALAVDQSVKGLDRRTTARLRRLLPRATAREATDALHLSPLLPLVLSDTGTPLARDGDWHAPLPSGEIGWSIRLTTEMLLPPPLGVVFGEYLTQPAGSGLHGEYLHRWSIPIALPAGARISIELEYPSKELDEATFAIIANAHPLAIDRVERSTPSVVTLTTAPTDAADDLTALELLLYVFDDGVRAAHRAAAVRAIVLHAEAGASA